ncbi:MAG: hypothetical protein GY778_22560, partial [bacterium]|nr:hypothetical protein [bacterium]
VDFPIVYPTKVTLGQFHVAGGPVIWMFRNRAGGYFVNRQDELGRGYGFDKILTDEEMRGRWNDMLVHIRWAKDTTGFFKVWANGKRVYDYAGPTLASDRRVYFKIGIYRSAVSRFQRATGLDEVPAQIVYYDEIRRGRTRREVTRHLSQVAPYQHR